MKTREKILYELATKNVVTRKALTIVSKNHQSVMRCIADLLAKGYIREREFKVKRKGKHSLSVPAYTITRTGIEFLKDELYRAIPWADELEDIEILTRTVNNGGTNQQLIATNFFRYSTAGVFADMCGAGETFVYINDDSVAARELTMDVDENLQYDEVIVFDEADTENGEDFPTVTHGREEDSTDGLPISAYIQNAAAAYEYKLQKKSYAHEVEAVEPAIQFYSGLTIKRIVERLLTGKGVISDVRAGRLAGMFVVDQKATMLYVGTAYIKSLTSQWAWKRDENCFRAMCTDYLEIKLSSSQKPNGIVLVSSKDVFNDLYNAETYTYEDKVSKKHVKTPHTNDETFNQLIAIPMSRFGAQELKTVLETDIEEEKSSIVKILTKSSDFFRNTEVSEELFPIVDAFDTLYAVGVHLDLCQVRYIERIKERFKGDKSFGIVCRKWQIPYYESILHDVEIRDIDEYLKGTTVRDPERTELKLYIESVSEIERAHHPQRW